jgi:hypothetical protein
MANKIAIFIDGSFLRVVARKAKRTYDPNFIEKFAHACNAADEDILRVLYQDCAPSSGTVQQPVSGLDHVFSSNDGWPHALSHKNQRGFSRRDRNQ